VCIHRSIGVLGVGLVVGLTLAACSVDMTGVASAEPAPPSGVAADGGATARRASAADVAPAAPDLGTDLPGDPAAIDAAEADAAEADATEADAIAVDAPEIDASPPPPPDAASMGPQLLLSLPLDDDDGAMAAGDRSGLGQQVTLHRLNAARCWVDGHRGGALALQRDGYLQVGIRGALGTLRAFSFATWFWRERSDDDGVLVSRGAAGNGGYAYRIWISGEHLRVQLNDPGPLDGMHRTSRSPLAVRRWLHLAVTFDGRRVRLYQDGAPTDDWPYERPLAALPAARPLLIGASESPSDEEGVRDRLTGRLDEVMFYDGALPPEQVAELAGARPRGAQPPPP
jgi:hypothetical protein